MARLDNKKAVITGASSGIGREMALAFAREGAHVVVNFRKSAAAAEDVVNEIRSAGGTAHAVCADVSSEEEVSSVCKLLPEVITRAKHNQQPTSRVSIK